MVNQKTADDPRDPSLEVKVTFPKIWNRESFADVLGVIAMFLSCAVILTRNRLLIWPALLLSMSSMINSHSLRVKEGPSSRSNMGMIVAALLSTYIPFFVLGPNNQRPSYAPPAT